MTGILNSSGHAQSTRPQFEVASIKQDKACDGRRGGGPPPAPGRLNMECTTLRSLIKNAYGSFADGVALNPRDLDIAGGPAWIASESYDVAAKAEDGASIAQMAGPMLQALLEDRFKLKVHRETREAAVYLLTVAKEGPQLERTKEGSCVSLDLNHLPPAPAPGESEPVFCGNQSMSSQGSNIILSARGITMELLANGALARVACRPILDKTGLVGRFDIQLEFTPDRAGARAGEPDASGPSIFEALRQLGLRLDPGKGAVEVLVVNDVERPSEN